MKCSFLFVLLFSACVASAAEPTQTAQASVLAWLELLDNEAYEESWSEAAPVFKESLSARRWARMADQARKPLGSVLSRKLIGAQYQSKLPGAPEADYLIFQFNTSFTGKDDAVETVTPMLVEGRWRVSGYFVR